MTGSLQTKKFKSGVSYYYVKINYKDAKTAQWKIKWVATGILAAPGNKRIANKKVAEVLDQYSYLERESNLPKDILLSEYIDLWLSTQKHQIKQSSYEGYVYRANAIKRYFEGKQVVQITPKMVDDFYKYSLKYGKTNKKTKEKEPLSVRSVRSYGSILYAVYTQAMIDGLVITNPTDGIHVHGKKNKDYQEEYLFMTEEEISELLHFLSEHEMYRRLVPIAFMGAYYGMRRSEILGLKWSTIDFKKKTISIQHTVVRVKNLHKSDITKTPAGKRVLNLFPTAESCLLGVKEMQEIRKKFYKDSYQNTDGYVFTWEDGRTYDPDYITKLFGKATKAFGRPEITLHKLRHSCASMLINKGWDIKKLQYWLGHEDTTTTLDIYAHFNKQRLNASTNDLSEISMASADLFS